MLRSLIVLFCLWPVVSAAQQTVVLDAFGLHFGETSPAMRKNWAGFVLRNGSPNYIAPKEEAQLYFFFGEKSQVAKKGIGHAVSIGVDSHGNLIADGSPVSFKAGDIEITAPTFDGIADVLFPAGFKSGVFDALSKTALVQSGRRVFRILPDISTTTVNLSEPVLEAAPQSFATLETEAMKDAYGNLLTDGISLPLIGKGDNQTYSVATAQTFGAKALARFLTRDIANNNDLQIGLSSASQQNFSLSVSELRLSAQPIVKIAPINGHSVLQLSIEPLRTTQDQLLPDGTPLSITTKDDLGRVSNERYWVKDGIVQTLLPHSIKARSFDVTVETPDEIFSLKVTLSNPVEVSTRAQNQ